MQDTFGGIARFLPRPRAGEGWGERVFSRAGVVCFSLTLALSQGEGTSFPPSDFLSMH